MGKSADTVIASAHVLPIKSLCKWLNEVILAEESSLLFMDTVINCFKM